MCRHDNIIYEDKVYIVMKTIINNTKDKDILTSKFVVCILAVFCCLLWGSAFPSIKAGYRLISISSNDTASQIAFAGIRFTIAGIMVIIIGSILQRKVLIPQRKTISKVFTLSMFQTIIQYVLFYIGLANTSGVKASIIEGANVFVAIIVAGVIFRQEKITSKKMIGCIIGFAGVILVNMNGKGMDLSFSIKGEGVILLSTVAAAVSAVLMKEYAKKENPVLLSGYQFFVGGTIMMLMGFECGGHIDINSTKAWILLLYMAFISAAAYTIWGILLKHNPVSKVSVYGFTNPVFGVILSSIILNEKGQLSYVYGTVALVLVCIGIYVVNSEQSKKVERQDP